MTVLVRNRPIYRPIFGFYRYIGRYLGFTDISADIWVLPIDWYRPKRLILSASIGVDKTLLYSSRIQTTWARKHNEASQDSYLTTTLAGAVSQTNRQINHEAWVSCHNRNKSIIGKFRNAWSHHVQVLCTHKLPLYFQKFWQHERFDWYLRCRSPINA